MEKKLTRRDRFVMAALATIKYRDIREGYIPSEVANKAITIAEETIKRLDVNACESFYYEGTSFENIDDRICDNCGHKRINHSFLYSESDAKL